jgi:hypothetical protein
MNMKEKKTVRYLGNRMLADGGRSFNFSVTPAGEEEADMVSIDAPASLFQGPDRIAIQEGAGICYETLRSRIETDAPIPTPGFFLDPSDIAQHRRVVRMPGRRFGSTAVKRQ